MCVYISPFGPPASRNVRAREPGRLQGRPRQPMLLGERVAPASAASAEMVETRPQPGVSILERDGPTR